MFVEDPAETAIAEVGYDGIDDARDGATDGATGVATNGLADGSDAGADLLKNTLDGAGNCVVGSHSGEALFDDLSAGLDGVLGEFTLGDAFGHHGDLAGFVGIGDKVQNEPSCDAAE